MNKVSIILPAYNCEKTIARAIESILSQTYREWELIIINDGSTDNTDKICQDYISDVRIKYIIIENKGVSNARNLGIQNATGKYVMFIDSDDTYNEKFIEVMEKNIDKNELICCSYKMIYDDSDEISGPELNEDIAYQNKEIYNTINYLHKKNSLKMLWNKMFVLDKIKINNIKMRTEISYGEDYLFIVDYLKEISSIKIINEQLYNYYIHSKGLSTKYNEDALDNRLYTLGYHEKMYIDKDFPLDYIKNQYIIAFYAEIVNFYFKNNKLKHKEKINIIKKYLEKEEIIRKSKEKNECSIMIYILKFLIKYRLTILIFIISSIETKLKSKEKFYKNRRK